MPAKKPQTRRKKSDVELEARWRTSADLRITFKVQEASIIAIETGNDEENFIRLCRIAYDRTREMYNGVRSDYIAKAKKR